VEGQNDELDLMGKSKNHTGEDEGAEVWQREEKRWDERETKQLEYN
jgi:hypothetical protein